MSTLETLLLAEQTRCRQLLREYAELGSAGAFARALLEDSLRGADEALRTHEAEPLCRALERLQRFQSLNPMAILVSRGMPQASRAAAPRSAVWAPVRPREQFFTWTQAAA